MYPWQLSRDQRSLQTVGGGQGKVYGILHAGGWGLETAKK